jgi:hypothetical protein
MILNIFDVKNAMSANEEQTNVVRFNISYINRFNISLGIAMKIAQLVQALDEAPRPRLNPVSPAPRFAQNRQTQQPQTSVSTAPSAGTQAAAGTSQDPTLAQPLPAQDPNAPGLGTRLGQGIGKIAKGIGAVAGVPAGIGRAIKKGYQAGANAVGGPGAAQSAPSAASSNAGSAELDQLKATLQSMDQRLRRAGFESKK